MNSDFSEMDRQIPSRIQRVNLSVLGRGWVVAISYLSTRTMVISNIVGLGYGAAGTPR